VSPVRIVAVLFACLLGCSGDLNGSHPGDGGAQCCPISDESLPGACVDLGGAVPAAGPYCVTTCDGPNDFVRIIDEKGCPKFVERACADGSADPICH
jgi:hypothetical protein